jgi:ribose transport system substrate-binding protein
MKRGKTQLFIILVVILFFLNGLIFAGGKPDEKAAEKETITIGVNLHNVAMTWMKFAQDAMIEEGENLGIELIMLDAENDVAKQAANMEDLIALKVDGIVVPPLDVSGLNPAINSARAAGIPVATFDRAAIGADYIFYVGCDDVKGGRFAGEFVAEKLNGKAKIIHIYGTPGSSPARDRTKGLHEVVDKYPGMEIVFEQTGEFFIEKAMQTMEDALMAVPTFDAVVCQDDNMMLGAIEAMKAAGIDPEPYVITGYGGFPDGLRAIRDGIADCSISYPIEMAPEVLRRMVDYLRGKSPAEKDYEIPPIVITKDNLEEGDFYSMIAND